MPNALPVPSAWPVRKIELFAEWSAGCALPQMAARLAMLAFLPQLAVALPSYELLECCKLACIIGKGSIALQYRINTHVQHT